MLAGVLGWHGMRCIAWALHILLLLIFWSEILEISKLSTLFVSHGLLFELLLVSGLVCVLWTCVANGSVVGRG